MSQANADALLVQLLRTTSEYGVILTSAENRILWLNEAAQRMLSLDEATALDMNLRDTFTTRDAQLGVPEQELRISHELGFAHNDRWHARSNGGTFWTSGVLTVLRDEQGEFIAHCKVFRDRTDLREQIVQAENATREAVRMQQHSLNSMITLAHEVRAPLTACFNATAILKKQLPGDANTTSAVEILDRQLRVIHSQLEELLDVTRITAGKVRLRLTATNVQEILNRSIETLLPSPLARERIRVVLPDSPAIVMADAARLEQVFVNLIGNALKFTPDDGDISIALEIADEDVVVYITDTGIGIPTELLPRIFDLFTQAPPPREGARSPNDGLGIGLTVVRELVELHGGSVQVRSDGEGHGAEFTIHLPLANPGGETQR